MQEFTSLIESLISSPSEFIITGDFNFHVDDPSSPPAASFLSILDHFGLSQYVTFPTHRAGHTLDLLVARTSSEMIRTVECSVPFISDHHAILSAVSIPCKTRVPWVTKTIRSIKSRGCFSYHTNSELSGINWLQVSLPIRDGGLGIRSVGTIRIPCFGHIHTQSSNTHSLKLQRWAGYYTRQQYGSMVRKIRRANPSSIDLPTLLGPSCDHSIA